MFFQLNSFVRRRGLLLAVFSLYAVEFLDEFIYGLAGAVLPALKTDLALTYTQAGLLLSVPSLVAVFAEPLVGLLGDTRHRRLMVLGGIIATSAGLALAAAGQVFPVILAAYIVLATASGAYVNLSQATLIDRDPDRAEPTMARWVLVGSVAVTVSPVITAAALYAGLGWRGLYWGAAGLAGCFIALLWPHRFDSHAGADDEEPVSPRKLAGMLWEGLRNAELLRWVLLAEVADLMLDRHLEVTGLYFHDVLGVSLPAASAAVAWMSAVGLVGSLVFVPLIDRLDGLRLLRVTAGIVLAAYVAYLSLPWLPLKVALIGLISFCTAGWFPVLRARSYQAFAGKSGIVNAVSSVANLSSLVVPLVVGRVADAWGLPWAMWLLALGPAALLLALPGGRKAGAS